MPTPSLGGRERIGLSHKVRDGHRESVFVPRDPGTSISTSGSDVGYLGRAGSFYTAWCQMHELFCISCIAKLSGQTFRCSCGHEQQIESTRLCMIGAHNSVMSAFDLSTGAKPAGTSEGFTPMNSPSQALSVPNALLTLLELPQALRCHSTGHLSGYYEGDASSHCTSTAVIAVPPGPHGARATAMTQCSSAVGGSIIVSPRSWTSSRRTSRGKCPAAQWPDEG